MLEYIRVTDQDTGHKLSILKAELPNGNYRELKAPAVDRLGTPLPPEHNAVKPLSSTTNEAKTAADTTKE